MGLLRSDISACSRCAPFLRLGFHISPRSYVQRDYFRQFCQSKSRKERISSWEQGRRSYLSRLWVPSGGIAKSDNEDAHAKLVRAGFLRQAHSGIFHMMPLGRRVQDKIERLIDKHMYNLGASRLDLSSISSDYLWEKSGRLTKANSELFRFRDRKDSRYLLSPTHEEEITNLVADTSKSYKDLPTRLYQITRKYRDELRPRHGLLRAREFVMKDLYTFDTSKNLALETYDEVRIAYTALFDELKIPYLVAEAASGDMGGNLSHEFHFLTSKGEDRVISCGNCDYVANEELAQTALSAPEYGSRNQSNWKFVPPEDVTRPNFSPADQTFSVWRGISKDRATLVNVWYALSSNSPSIRHTKPEINTHAIKVLIPDLDGGVENAATLWAKRVQSALVSGDRQASILPSITNLVDYRLPRDVLDTILAGDSRLPFWADLTDMPPPKVISSVIFKDPSSDTPLNLVRIQNGDTCPRCRDGQLKVSVAIEVGHTFFLGTRYSEPFKAVIALPEVPLEIERGQTLMQMGCHGIGVSRMIGAVAEMLADDKGLNWPRVIAPYEAIVIPTRGHELDAASVYDALIRGPDDMNQPILDVILDDRSNSFAWKMRDADLVGYPVIVVVGKSWEIEGSCEVQCRRLELRENIPLKELSSFVQKLLVKL